MRRMPLLSVRPKSPDVSMIASRRPGSEVSLPEAEVAENEEHDYYDSNDVEDTVHSVLFLSWE